MDIYILAKCRTIDTSLEYEFRGAILPLVNAPTVEINENTEQFFYYLLVHPIKSIFILNSHIRTSAVKKKKTRLYSPFQPLILLEQKMYDIYFCRSIFKHLTISSLSISNNMHIMMMTMMIRSSSATTSKNS